MKRFLSCDWGTSSFRLRLVVSSAFTIVGEEKSNQGISATYAEWLRSGNAKMEDRMAFYLKIVKNHIWNLEQKLQISLKNVPVLFSGMASASIGMKELSYGSLPFGLSGEGIPYRFFEKTDDFPHPVFLISGVKSDDDVMRGEETQLIGGLMGKDPGNGTALAILPGTHSKHIMVRDGQVVSFRTYMTGEFFELLSKKSILKASLEENRSAELNNDPTSFCLGLKEGFKKNLLSTAFRVRTNDLFGKLTKAENSNYLSGLLIGAELIELELDNVSDIYLICNSDLKERYHLALVELGAFSKLKYFSSEWEDKAALRGQYQICKQYN